ncbi:reverse transcriptase domain, reverse transcriptase zinc-binding domain protein [Tanacetum coccineum]
MGDSDWQTVTGKNRRSVFERLNISKNSNSNRDDLAKISLTVYVSNFPSHLTVRELWNTCGKKGTLVDVYIAKHKNKLGQMFAFCRFIKKCAVESSHVVQRYKVLETSVFVMLGKCLERKLAVKPSHVGATVHNSRNINLRPVGNSVKVSSYANATKASVGGVNAHYNEGFVGVETKYLGGLWVLFEFYDRDTRDSFIKHEGVLSWFSLLKPWHDDFVVDERLIWLELEGVPLLAWNNVTFKNICSRWGEVLYIDDNDNTNSWTPSFSFGDEDNEEEQLVGFPSNNEDTVEKEDDVISVAESVGDIPVKEPMEEHHSKQHDSKDADDNGINTVDTDPFELADLIARKCQQEQEFSAVRKPKVQEEATKASVLRDSVSMMNEAV